ncbi:MAG: T9SS type A sorting domain-containing protein [Candidatus Marinimicrobia bacterium]|nr:T9SS type A sorting domain-containing protein [Candidatus Neomarinimicrobiota bacterium]
MIRKLLIYFYVIASISSLNCAEFPLISETEKSRPADGIVRTSTLPKIIHMSSTSAIVVDQNQTLDRLEIFDEVVWMVSITGSDIDGDGSPENPFASIQNGIIHAADGDTILVHPGEYFENINFLGKNIVVTSVMSDQVDENQIYQTIINGNNNGTTVTFENGEDSTAVLNGFAITGGSGTYFNDGLFNHQTNGGGILCLNSSPVLKKVNINENILNGFSQFNGAGIYSYNSTFKLQESRISNNILNSAHSNGAAVYCLDSAPVITNVIINNNVQFEGNPNSTIIYLDNTNLIVNNNTIYNNILYSGAGLARADNNSHLSIKNSILWNNYPYNIVGSLNDNNVDGELTISYSNLQSGLDSISDENLNVNWLGENIDAIPLLIDPAGGDFNLHFGSPCIDSGDPSSSLDPDNSPADMGALYYDHSQDDNPTVTFTLNSLNLNTGTVEVWIENNSPIYGGFQFNMTGIQVSDAVISDLYPDYYITYSNDGLILAWSLSQTLIEPGYQKLCTIFFDDIIGDQLCIEDGLFPNSEGGNFDNIDYGDCRSLIELQLQHFTNVINGFENEYLEFSDTTGYGFFPVILVEDVIGGVDIGDEIGLFDYNGQINTGDCDDNYGEILVGAGVWQGGPLHITAYGAMDFCDDGDDDYGQYSGWINGNPMVIRVWRASENHEYEVIVGNGNDLVWSEEDINIQHIMPVTRLPYDMNSDYATDAIDIELAINFLFGVYPLPDQVLSRIDFNLDGVINIFDLVNMINQIMGYEISISEIPVYASILINENTVFLDSDIDIAGIQLSIAPGLNLTGLVDESLNFEYNEGIIIIYSIEESSLIGRNPLFLYDGNLVISEVLISDKSGNSVEAGVSLLPTEFRIDGIYPNPFNSNTTIKFDLESDTILSLKIYDLLGREVDILLSDEFYYSGEYQVSWNPTQMASGIYFARLSRFGESDMVKIMLLK